MHRTGSAAFERAGIVQGLVFAAVSAFTGGIAAQEPAEESSADRGEEILATVRLALRERSARRSLVDDVDPVRGPRQDRALAYTLRTTRVTAKLEDQSLDEVLEFLRKTTAVNFVVTRGAREALAAKGAKGGRVTMFLEDLPLENLLNLLELQLPGCRFTVEYGAVVLVRAEQHRPKRVVVAHDVRDLVRRSPDFPAPRLGLGGLGGLDEKRR